MSSALRNYLKRRTQSRADKLLGKPRLRIPIRVKLVEFTSTSSCPNEKFKQGVALNSDLLDAEVALLQAKTNLTQAQIDYEISVARLEKSVGE